MGAAAGHVGPTSGGCAYRGRRAASSLECRRHKPVIGRQPSLPFPETDRIWSAIVGGAAGHVNWTNVGGYAYRGRRAASSLERRGHMPVIGRQPSLPFPETVRTASTIALLSSCLTTARRIRRHAGSASVGRGPTPGVAELSFALIDRPTCRLARGGPGATCPAGAGRS